MFRFICIDQIFTLCSSVDGHLSWTSWEGTHVPSQSLFNSKELESDNTIPNSMSPEWRRTLFLEFGSESGGALNLYYLFCFTAVTNTWPKTTYGKKVDFWLTAQKSGAHHHGKSMVGPMELLKENVGVQLFFSFPCFYVCLEAHIVRWCHLPSVGSFFLC